MISQVHDFNGGIPLSGLFWTVELSDDAFYVSRNKRRAFLEAKDVPVINTFQFGNPFLAPSTVSFKVEWEATGMGEDRGLGKGVSPDSPASFLGNFAPAISRGRFSGAQLGFEFKTKRRASTIDTYAAIGTERNGTFLS